MKGPRGAPARIVVDGREVAAFQGESLAAALLAAGILGLRSSPRAGTPRGAFCFMGVCQECVVEVAGATAQACQVAVADGMVVRLVGPHLGPHLGPHAA
ncbi:MAG: (2Fe-2S)-binding protein [Acetobacteraceae bacterium]|nr:(2Fe-2S)-binding protein [Acetobacteraceae bacterium]